MQVRTLPSANRDLISGFRFYERQEPGAGDYFLKSLNEDIESLAFTGGIHAKEFGYYRKVTERFPHSIYYLVQDGVVTVHAVLDTRRNPARLRRRLK